MRKSFYSHQHKNNIYRAAQSFCGVEDITANAAESFENHTSLFGDANLKDFGIFGGFVCEDFGIFGGFCSKD